jgi:hypothetical protein
MLLVSVGLGEATVVFGEELTSLCMFSWVEGKKTRESAPKKKTQESAPKYLT